MTSNTNKQQGAAAIFIVVFFAILISIIALSFLRIAVQDQQQATNNDLSQSAYDSASAGLEDAKRALSWYNLHCPVNSAPAAIDAPNCTAYNTAFNNPRCNLADIITGARSTLPYADITPSTNTEVKVNSSPGGGDEKLDQAYTCVTITKDTPDYKATTTAGTSDALIPLRTVNNDPFDTIEFNWFTPEEAGTNVPSYPTSPKTLSQPWPDSAPPVMRFQLIPVLRGGLNIKSIDADSRTVFLYPSKAPGLSEDIPLSGVDPGRTITNPSFKVYEKNTQPSLAKCEATITGPFACNVRIKDLPAADANPANTDYYLRVTAFYKNTTFQLRLRDSASGAIKLFNNVEPQVDTTGRANNVFRRVQARVRPLTSSNPLSDGGFDITKGVCKNFNVPVYKTDCPDNLVEP